MQHENDKISPSCTRNEYASTATLYYLYQGDRPDTRNVSRQIDLQDRVFIEWKSM